MNTCVIILSLLMLICNFPYTHVVGESHIDNQPIKKLDDDHSIISTAIGRENGTDFGNSSISTTEAPKIMPEKDSEAQEHKSSMAIFFILLVIILSILLVHMLIVTKFNFIPESLAIVILGVLIGLTLQYSGRDWRAEEALQPNAFFLIVLPPIIFESGYNLHKGNFFANLGSVLTFAILGTLLSAFVVGGGIYVLGQASLVFELTAVDSFAFGAMISAVDPIATLAIFNALNVDPLLYMLVFGESVLNDAVAIVLAATVLELNDPSISSMSTFGALSQSFLRFLLMFFGSAFMGVVAGLTSALLLKHIDLRKTPSLEFGVMLIFAYLPYGLAEGIMAILFCGITMSHYTHFNLSPMTQITMQQTFRTLAFVAETCTFAYLGMAFFTFPLVFDPVFIVWAIILCLFGRAINIFPLSFLVNKFREHQISRKNQLIMWFSGLRGAVAFALSLHMKFENDITQRILLATTLSVVIFTIVLLGGSTMPLLKMLDSFAPNETKSKKRKRKRRRKQLKMSIKSKGNVKKKMLMFSKTQEMKPVLDTDYSFSEYADETDEGYEPSSYRLPVNHLKGLAQLDAHYFRPFFVRKFTVQEKQESTMKLTDLALEWYKAAQQDTDSDEEMNTVFVHNHQRKERSKNEAETKATTSTRISYTVDSSDDAGSVHFDTNPLINETTENGKSQESASERIDGDTFIDDLFD